MSQWFSAIDGQQAGPHDDRQLREMIRSGRLGSADLVWRQGMPEWMPVASVPELSAAAAQPAPPLPGMVPPAPVYASAPAAQVARPWGNPAGAPQAAWGQQPYPQGAPAAPGAAPSGGMLSYATPSHLAPAPAAQVPVVMPDDGPFLRVGGSFTAKGRWNGAAIVSPRAFYLLKVSQQMNHYAGGVVGMLVSMAVAGDDDVRSCQVGHLPPAVQQQLNPKGRYIANDVIVLPREAIRLVKVPAINNAVYVHAGTEKFTIFTVLFRGGRIRRFLGENGWIVNQEVIPSAAPVHGQGFGRYPGGPARKQMSTAMRVLLVIVAIIIFILFVALRVATDSNRY